jgi:signal transduction histidine kinase
MDTIVSHMLKYAAPPRPAFANVRLHEILEHSLRMLQPRIGSKMILVNRDFRAQEDWLAGDDHQLEQAFLNLLFNAVDAIGQEGALKITTELVGAGSLKELNGTRKTGPLLRIRFSDTGAGISADNLKKIFDPFFTTKPRGNGLGLAVSRRIIEGHEGTIGIESHLGKGTTVTILLPTGAQKAGR